MDTEMKDAIKKLLVTIVGVAAFLAWCLGYIPEKLELGALIIAGLALFAFFM